MKLKRTEQCAKCPWRKDVNPRDIPDGYSEEKHAALHNTIASENLTDFINITNGRKPLRVMACHETDNAHCLGWLMNQIGPGNNIALRIMTSDCENLRDVKLHGEQHARFKDTLPTPHNPAICPP